MTSEVAGSAVDDPLTASLRHASQLLVEGQIEAAGTVFRRVLAFEPRQHDALHLLGVARHRSNDHADAVRLIGRAIALTGPVGSFLDNLRIILRSAAAEGIAERFTIGSASRVAGLVWSALGDAALRGQREDAAIAAFRRAIALAPFDAPAFNGLGCAHDIGTDHRRSLAAFERGLAVDPFSVDLRFNCASVRIAAGRHQDATGDARIAIALSPSFAGAYQSLGAIYRKLRRLKEATAAFDRGCALSPGSAVALTSRAAVLAELRRYDQAARDLRRSIAIDPAYGEGLYNLARVCVDRHAYDLARTLLRRFLWIHPEHIDGRVTLGAATHALGRPREALACYRRLQALFPDQVGAHWNEAQVLFDLGDLPRAWRKHEFRFRALGGERHLNLRRWHGEELSTGRLLVWAEQGIGDELIFASLFGDVLARTPRSIFECDARLLTLFRRSFPQAEFFARSNETEFEAARDKASHHIPAGSLPSLFRPRIETFPAHQGYLRADGVVTENWRRRLDALGPGPKIGISWRSQSILPHREPFMMTVGQIVQAASVPGAILVNLQYDECREELARLEDEAGIRVHDFADLNQKNEIDRVAALMCGLDVIVSAGTSVAALAGALGVPLWQFSTYPSPFDTLGTDHTPWFPRVRFIERRQSGDWAPTISRISKEVTEYLRRAGF